MIGTINNFVISTQELYNDITTFTFEFDKPTGNVGGYYLYISLDGTNYSEVFFRVDYIHYRTTDTDTNYTIDSGTKSYFEYVTTSDLTDGRLLYFKLQAISEFNELSADSDIVTTYTAPSRPDNLLVIYDGDSISLTWDDLNTSSGINSAFDTFKIYRKRITELSNVTATEVIVSEDVLTSSGTITKDTSNYKLTHASLTLDSSVWVIDGIKRSRWFGIVTTEGEFTISNDNKITLASDISEEYIIPIDNIRVLVEDNGTSIEIGQSATASYIDTTFTNDFHYIYAITSITTEDTESEQTTYPIYPITLTNAAPYLRSPGNSDNSILHQTYWKTLKSVLIDSNYYDKNQFSIPYFKDEVYNLKGYLGVSNCKLDIFINDIITFTTSTGNYGEFDINYQFKKGWTNIKLQARNQSNNKFSRYSAPYSIRTFNMYAWFSAMGEEYVDIDNEIEALKQDADITTCRYASLVDRFIPFIGFYKQGPEDEEKFRNIITAAYQAFEFAAYDESLNMILDAFQDNTDHFDHYEIYYNERLYGTQRTQYAFAITSTGLSRDDFYYGISAGLTSSGYIIETDITPLRVDRRWWPGGYYSANILLWDYVANAEFYRIYRSTNGIDYYALTSTGYNVFIDINGYPPILAETPRLYNYTSIDNPQNLTLYDRYGVHDLFLKLKKSSSLVIILYGKEDEEIEDYNIERLLLLFEKVIPPEIKYLIIFANDTKVVLYPEGREVDLTIYYDYANYDESYYYHSSIETNEVYS